MKTVLNNVKDFHCVCFFSNCRYNSIHNFINKKKKNRKFKQIEIYRKEKTFVLIWAKKKKNHIGSFHHLSEWRD